MKSKEGRVKDTVRESKERGGKERGLSKRGKR